MAVSLCPTSFGEVPINHPFYLDESAGSCFIKVDQTWSLHSTCWADMRIILSEEARVWVICVKKPVRKIKTKAKKRRSA